MITFMLILIFQRIISSNQVLFFFIQRHNATVTVVNEHTPNPAEETKKADIVVSATGVAHLVRGHWLKKGAVVLDVGTSAIEVNFKCSAYASQNFETYQFPYLGFDLKLQIRKHNMASYISIVLLMQKMTRS